VSFGPWKQLDSRSVKDLTASRRPKMRMAKYPKNRWKVEIFSGARGFTVSLGGESAIAFWRANPADTFKIELRS
jgi:hypothetical protein